MLVIELTVVSKPRIVLLKLSLDFRSNTSFNAISNEEYPEENMSLILIIVIIVVILVFVVVVLIIVFLTKKSDLPVANSNNQNQVSTNNIQMQGV